MLMLVGIVESGLCVIRKLDNMSMVAATIGYRLLLVMRRLNTVTMLEILAGVSLSCSHGIISIAVISSIHV
jgi:hypothetical protein